MSDNKIQNEQELWDVLSSPVGTDAKADAPKAEPAPKEKSKEGRFAKPGPVKEAAPAKEGRKLDGFFYACMAGVAAVSVAATLVLGGMLGGNTPAGEQVSGPVETDPAIVETDGRIAELELLNAELRAQVELQKDQIKKLQADLLDLTNASGQEPVISTEPGADNELVNEQLEAYEIWSQIQAAYTDFDREKLEELIPEMDKRLTYLSNDALYEYYLILEYVEQPSNG